MDAKKWSVGIVKRLTLLRVTKGRKFWRAMIVHILRYADDTALTAFYAISVTDC